MAAPPIHSRTPRGVACRLAGCFLVVLSGCAGADFDAGEAERIAELLALAPGTSVADVGAGDGEWAVDLARRVGAEGRVVATEVEADKVETIRRHAEEAGLDNVAVYLGDQESTGLPDSCCDSILLRLVYHHFTDPAAMRASLKRALRAGGRLVVIDIEPQKGWRKLEGVPERGGHGIPAEELVRDLVADGFRLLGRRSGWEGEEDRYAVVVTR